MVEVSSETSPQQKIMRVTVMETSPQISSPLMERLMQQFRGIFSLPMDQEEQKKGIISTSMELVLIKLWEI